MMDPNESLISRVIVSILLQVPIISGPSISDVPESEQEMIIAAMKIVTNLLMLILFMKFLSIFCVFGDPRRLHAN